jgi:hypothetical protein
VGKVNRLAEFARFATTFLSPKERCADLVIRLRWESRTVRSDPPLPVLIIEALKHRVLGALGCNGRSLGGGLASAPRSSPNEALL